MSTGIVYTIICVFCFTGVYCTQLEPSPIASFRRYTSNVFNCSVDTNWTTVIFNMIKNSDKVSVAFFTGDQSKCNDVLPSNNISHLYQTSCDYRSRQFYLTIKNVTDSFDANILECIPAYSPSKPGTVQSTINVQYPPIGLPSITQTSVEPPIEGNRVVLSCEILGGNPLANITFKCSGFTSVDSTSSTTKIVSSIERRVMKDDNNKECTCVGKHSFWIKDKEEKYNLTVYYRATVIVSPAFNIYDVVENTSAQLNCTVVDANPTVTSFTWYKDGLNISTADTYTLPSVNRLDTGRYTCEATNIAGRSLPSSALKLNVLYGIHLNPINKSEPTEGEVLNITCSGQSYPAMTDNDVSWTKQNNDTFGTKGRHLVIYTVNRLDSGTYMCSVLIHLTPTLGTPVNRTAETHVVVNVLYKPTVKISQESSPYILVENTTNFMLNCTVTDANPTVSSFMWYKDNSFLSSFDVYRIPSVHRSNTGSYTCEARNSAGTSDLSSAVSINVLYGIDIKPISKTQPTEGTFFNITCSGNSNPAMTDDDVSWTKQNNKTFKGNGRQLVFANINRKNGGTYICSVFIQLTPNFGSQVNVTGTTTAEVDVLYRPTVVVSTEFNPSFVTENQTNLRMVCTVTDGNPADYFYSWKKDGSAVSSAEKYVISSVKRADSGNYTCNSTNIVGTSDPSPVFQLNVLFGVSLLLSETEISVNESEEWYISCIGDGNPMPTISCISENNNSAVGEQKTNMTSINIVHANCMDTGLYTCFGNNSIGEPVSTSADIKVACRPRTYDNLDKEYIFINGTDESLSITTRFISFPLSIMSWSRKKPNGNWTELSNEFHTSVSSSLLPFEQTSLLQKDRLEPDEFGIYVVKASNMHGSFILTYDVISKREPDPPTNITTSCDSTSIKITWISRFNGGENQTFRINIVNNKSNQTTYKDGITDKGKDEIIYAEQNSLTPDTLYRIFVEAYNLYGKTTSTEIANCSTDKNQVEKQNVSPALIGGITGSISALLIVVIVIGVLYFWRRRQGRDNKLLKRHSKDTDEDEEGLKTNPLYVTSGELGPVYGVVNKKKRKTENVTLEEDNDQGPVYSQVQKPTSPEKKKGKEKKVKKTPTNEKYKDIELGALYENSDKVSNLNTSDELYANDGEQGKGVNSTKGYIPKKNKDGLIYADLDLVPGPNGRKFVIRGIENKTNYAMIDLSIKVDPLPSDDDEEENKDSEKAKSGANECNE